MPSTFSIEVGGLDRVTAHYLKLSAFQKLLRIPLNAALGEAKPIFQAEVGSRKASRSMTVRIRRETDGLIGKVGPFVGKAAIGRLGFLTALFRERGTGIHAKVDNARISAQKSARKGRAWKGAAMSFPSQKVVNARFPLMGSGRRAAPPSIFTKTGRVKASAIRNYGNAGFAVIRSSAGSAAHPWFDRAATRSVSRVRDRFRDELNKVIH